MARFNASPFGLLLPYSLFTTTSLQKAKKPSTRESQYFWDKAALTKAAGESRATNVLNQAESTLESNWLAPETPALSESEDETPARPTHKAVGRSKKHKRFSRLRHIAFRAFVPKEGSTQNSTVVSTEVIAKSTSTIPKSGDRASARLTIFNSWKIKSKGNKAEIKKMIAVVKTRISSASPVEEHPKTWDDYHRFYASECIDILNPPIPPTEPSKDPAKPTPYHSRLYLPPVPANEKIRQLMVNRFGFFGKAHFDLSEQGAENSKKRLELGDQLMAEGKAPTSLETSWQQCSSISSMSTADNMSQIPDPEALLEDVRAGNLPPETLEQHPVFRKIVQECREIFGTAISMLSVMDEGRQVFLAESGLGGMREVAREISFCAHTLLSGRKGFAILDTHKDWRFENGPLVQNYGSRFYAGVPLMAPNLDGSAEAEEDLLPLGTLCVVDVNPRDSFGIEERKKLVYMAEFARREIEKWYKKKMELKLKQLDEGHQRWIEELKQVMSVQSGEEANHSEVLSDPQPQQGNLSPFASLSQRLGRSRSSISVSSSLRKSSLFSSESPQLNIPGPSLFEDVKTAVKPKIQKVFDLATKLVAESLDLSLVYLLAVSPNGDSGEIGRTVVLSGYNLPSPFPVFDVGLHLRALRAPEGGLLYQNPTAEEAEEAALTPRPPPSSDDNADIPKAETYASAVLVAVGSERGKSGGGFVMAGFTTDPKRVFGEEDVSYINQFSQALVKYTSKLKL
ncbi:hypothetical protein O181_008090 [Austropuccinia psidii MF-1]|uniref:GAF domain-containing protein n=1 Tax=Austropuccinia psidii MF-1 TaxID=1389203 RepID=A0A9Q3BP98_9BASI|nr:hypothetical protein [Austropuccinia psidii MF-1]